MVAISEKAKKFNELFKQRLNRQHVLSLQACAHCGMCNDSCHYFLATGDPEMTPARKADAIRSVYKGHYDWVGKFFPFWVGARKVNTDEDLHKATGQAGAEVIG